MSQIDFAQVLIESFDQAASAINVQGNFSVSAVGVTGIVPVSISGWTVPNPIGVSGSALTSSIAGTATVNVVNQLAVSSLPSVGVSGTVAVSGSALTATVANFPTTQGISGSVSSVLVNSSGSAITVKTLSTQVASADFGLVTNSVLHGLTTGGGGGYVDVKVNPSGALSVDASNSSIAITSMPAVSVSGTSAVSGSISATINNQLAISSLPSVSVSSTVAVSGSALTASIAGTANVNVDNALAITSMPAVSVSGTSAISGAISATVTNTVAVSGNTNLLTVLGYAGSAVLIPPSAIQSSTGSIQSIGTIPANVKAVRIADTVGSFLAIYISTTASPAFVVEPGMADQLPYINSASAAVSARFLENVSPTAGYTLLEWLG